LLNQFAEAEIRAMKAEARADAAYLLANERAECIEDLRRMFQDPNWENQTTVVEMVKN